MFASARPQFAKATLLLPLCCSIGVCASLTTAQTRFDTRWDMQIEAMPGGIPLEINAFVAGDVDGDGDPDLLIAENAGSSGLYRNAGDGSFVFERFSGIAFAGHRAAVLVDVDGDGDLDAVFGGGRTSYDGPGPVHLLRNQGAGIFSISSTIPPQINSGLWFRTDSLGAGDIDHDGDQDLVFFSGDSHTRVWQNDGSGSFSDISATALPSVPRGRGRLVDLDGDGYLDVLTNNSWYRNAGNGTFAPVAGWSQRFYDVADMDGDGDLDLIDHDRILFQETSPQLFTAAGSIPPVFPWNGGIERITAVDFDGDGRKDLVGTDSAGRACLLRDTGNYVFVDVSAQWFEPHTRIDRTQGFPFGASTVLDIDGDGDPDLITGGSEGRNSTSTTVGIPPKVHINRARIDTRDASRPGFPWVQNTAYAMAAGDVDGDGDIDLMIGTLGYLQAPQRVSIWLQDAAGQFEESAHIPFRGAVGALALGDIDHDGDLDLFAAVGPGPLAPASSSRHFLALNDGLGNFQDVSTTHLPASVMSVGTACAFGDVDGDGDLDLAIGSREEGFGGGAGVPMQLLLNQGNGVFQTASTPLPQVAIEAGEMDLQDLDQDGDLDLVAVGDELWSGTSPLLFINDGSGFFQDLTSTRMPPATSAERLSVIDLDQDGDLDLACAGRNFLQGAGGVFTSRSAPANRMLAADLDEDGAVDAVRDLAGALEISGRLFSWSYNVHRMRTMAVDLDRDRDLDLVVACVLGYGDPNWSRCVVGVLYNQLRDLRLATLPRVGQPFRVSLRAGNGNAATLATVWLSTSILPRPIVLDGFGSLVLDPATMQNFGTVIIPNADTTAELRLEVPQDPAFIDLEIGVQAFFAPVGAPQRSGLSNAMVHRIVN